MLYTRVYAPCARCHDFAAAAAHEAGHVLGLDHPSGVAAGAAAEPPSPRFGALLGEEGGFTFVPEARPDCAAPSANAGARAERPTFRRRLLASELPTPSPPAQARAPSLMHALTQARAAACLEADDLAGLYALYPLPKPSCVAKTGAQPPLPAAVSEGEPGARGQTDGGWRPPVGAPMCAPWRASSAWARVGLALGFPLCLGVAVLLLGLALARRLQRRHLDAIARRLSRISADDAARRSRRRRAGVPGSSSSAEEDEEEERRAASAKGVRASASASAVSRSVDALPCAPREAPQRHRLPRRPDELGWRAFGGDTSRWRESGASEAASRDSRRRTRRAEEATPKAPPLASSLSELSDWAAQIGLARSRSRGRRAQRAPWRQDWDAEGAPARWRGAARQERAAASDDDGCRGARSRADSDSSVQPAAAARGGGNLAGAPGGGALAGSASAEGSGSRSAAPLASPPSLPSHGVLRCARTWLQAAAGAERPVRSADCSEARPPPALDVEAGRAPAERL